MWDWDIDSEPELNIQNKAQSQPTPLATDSDDSENAPLLSHTRVASKILPDKLEIILVTTRPPWYSLEEKISRKTLARKTPEHRGTFKPQWNIIPNELYNHELFPPYNNARH